MAYWRKRKSEVEPTPSPESQPPSAHHDNVIPQGQELRLGSSVHIRGEFVGTQDVVLCGTAQGQVNLPDHSFTVGPAARVEAEVCASRVIVEGRVTGNIVATDTVLVASTGAVKGNVSAPRVVLVDGCTFDGGVNHSDATRTERPTVVRNAAQERTQPVSREPRRQPGEDEQVWVNDNGAFWTMAQPYDDESYESDRPVRSPRRDDGRREVLYQRILDT
jgi:cytoskeletal protein CcmA (bactofilin family)